MLAPQNRRREDPKLDDLPPPTLGLWFKAPIWKNLRLVIVHSKEVYIPLNTNQSLLRQAPTEGGLYGEHLRRHLLNLENNETLLAAMKAVIAGDQAIAIKTSEAFKLTSRGLVLFQGSKVVPSCNLYGEDFRERLGVGA